jgi:regulator of cell morphogenesis and NO signaling
MIITDDRLDLTKVSVADIALSFPQAVEVLTRYNLDYCCGGKKSFNLVCKRAGLNPESIWEEIQLASISVGPDSSMRYDTWEAPLLIDFVIQHHHQYVRDSIPQIQALLDKVCNAHGDDSLFLLTVKDYFNKLAEELLSHLQKEEDILFHVIRKIFRASTSEEELPIGHHQLSSLLIVIEDGHEIAGQLIKSIRTLTNNYIPPASACPTFKLAYVMLNQFDKDLIQHVHLENNILFPKAMGIYDKHSVIYQ